jgi:hypothetical protein
MPPQTNKVDINAVNATTGKSNAQVLAEAQAVLDQTKAQGNVAFKGSSYDKPINIPTTDTTITSANLANTPNVVIPPPINNNTASNSLGATANGVVFGAEQSNANINNQSTVKSERQTYADKLKEAIGIQGTKGDFTLQAQNDAKLAEKNQVLTDINNEAITTKNAYEKQINDLYGSPGKSTAQIEKEAGAIRRQANQELSNIGIRQLVAQNNVLGAQKIIDDKVSAKFEPIDNQIKSYAQLIDIIDSDPQEKARLNAILAEKQSKFELNQNAYKTALNNAVQNGAPQAILSAIDKAAGDPNATAGTILASAGQYGVDKSAALDIQYKQAQIRNINNEIANRNVANGGQAVVSGNVANNVGLQNLPTEQKNAAVLTSLLNSKIGQGTRTQVANVLGVMQATESLAQARQTTGFKGISPFNAILNAKIPFTDIGIPFREASKSKEAVENSGYIEAINLKVQQWASGASLTKTQTDQVARFTPSVTDTDNQIRTKINNLHNFMLGQAQSQLQSEGITFVPEKVNLFELYDLIQKASPEQLSALKAQGLIK